MGTDYQSVLQVFLHPREKPLKIHHFRQADVPVGRMLVREFFVQVGGGGGPYFRRRAVASELLSKPTTC